MNNMQSLRYTDTNERNTQNKDKPPQKQTTLKTKKMRNANTNKNTRMNPRSRQE